MQVTTDADSPGVLISTEVMVPPYMVPAYSAASMMIPDVGGIPNVSGSSSATPETGPIPGSAPMSVPMTTPTIAMKMLNGVSAIPKPSARLAKTSTSEAEYADRERDLQPPREDRPVAHRSGQRDAQRDRPGVSLQEAQESEQEQRGRQRHAEDGQEHDEQHGGADHGGEPARAGPAGEPRPARVALARGPDQEDRGEHGHRQAEPERKEAGAGAGRAPVRVELHREGRVARAEQQQQDGSDLVGATHATTS